ncbi:MAG TPA: cysteine desulfurase family protein [Candidatus Omnitrophota bacterium]|nr:cysteine desulfurase family protein [Candidatus Omnitrophota bacterium]
MKQIYFDNAASTKVDERVLEAMKPYFTEKYANASSIHEMGVEAKRALEDSRVKIAKAINAGRDEIYFTSGGTEANNFALKGLFFSNFPKKNHIITTKIEHDCIINTCKWLEKQGAKVTYLDVDKEGFVSPHDIERAITDKTFLVTIIHGNNEIGTVQDIEAIGKICKEKKVLFHTDACQSFTKTILDVRKQNLDLATLNAHKIHGPKGVGALYIRKGIEITPLFHGGGHEKGMRSGTENVSGIVGFAKASELADRKHIEKMKEQRDRIINELLKFPGIKLNGAREKRLCNNVNISFEKIEGEVIGAYLENDGIMTSAGSACMSHSSSGISHVLKAIGLSDEKAGNSIRISISRFTTDEEIDYFLEKIKKILGKFQKS